MQQFRGAGGPGSGNFGHSGGKGGEGNPGGSSGPGDETPEVRRQETLASAQTNTLAMPFIPPLGSSNGSDAVRYIAAYGEEHTAAPLPSDVGRGTPKQCYKNASLLVMEREDLDYAEGIAYSGELGDLPFQHAWAVTKDGTVVDPTWDNPENSKYFGITYDRGRYLKYLYKAKLYGVLGSTDKNARNAIKTGGMGLRKL